MRVHEIETTGSRIIPVHPYTLIPTPWIAPPASYAVVDLTPVDYTPDGEAVVIARDGYNHTRVVIRSR